MAEMNTKSGLGTTSGVVSELSAFLTVRDGHEDELRAALQRYEERVSRAPREVIQKIGLRGFRHVIYDGGQRVVWSTSFDTDWDPYIDDALELMGWQTFLDFLKHLNEWPAADYAEGATNAEVKAFLGPSNCSRGS
jgi:hypothetical protein